MAKTRPLSIAETLGLSPLGKALDDAKLVFRGDPTVPPSKFDVTSLRIMTPRLAVGTWMGRRMGGRTIPILNLVNRTPTPPLDGWSVRVTQVRDFRGGGLTYDSHNGTDFVIPPGTITTAAAAGRVVSIRQEFNRGGLKVYVDHGRGLMTTYNHLGRSLVSVGELVDEGQPLALTGYSGIDGLTSFPWVAPHVHWNVIHGGVLVDPFAEPGETSLWRERNAPTPRAIDTADGYEPTTFEPDRVRAMLDRLNNPERRRYLERSVEPWRLAFELIIESTIYPSRFGDTGAGRTLFEHPPTREPRLALPFRGEDFDGIGFADEMGFRAAQARPAAESS